MKTSNGSRNMASRSLSSSLSKSPERITFAWPSKNQKSGKVGSAYQFVEIPDLKKNRLNLSDLFIVES